MPNTRSIGTHQLTWPFSLSEFPLANVLDPSHQNARVLIDGMTRPSTYPSYALRLILTASPSFAYLHETRRHGTYDRISRTAKPRTVAP